MSNLLGRSTEGVELYTAAAEDVSDGASPALNLDLSTISFVSKRGETKSNEFKETTDASDNNERNITLKGGTGFSTTTDTSGIMPGSTVSVTIGEFGTTKSGVSYNRISAMLVNQDNTVAAYGKNRGYSYSWAFVKY